MTHRTPHASIEHTTPVREPYVECWCVEPCCWDGTTCICPECCHNVQTENQLPRDLGNQG